MKVEIDPQGFETVSELRRPVVVLSWKRWPWSKWQRVRLMRLGDTYLDWTDKQGVQYPFHVGMRASLAYHYWFCDNE